VRTGGKKGPRSYKNPEVHYLGGEYSVFILRPAERRCGRKDSRGIKQILFLGSFAFLKRGKNAPRQVKKERGASTLRKKRQARGG